MNKTNRTDGTYLDKVAERKAAPADTRTPEEITEEKARAWGNKKQRRPGTMRRYHGEKGRLNPYRVALAMLRMRSWDHVMKFVHPRHLRTLA